MLSAAIYANETYVAPEEPVDFAKDRRYGVASAGFGFRYGRSTDQGIPQYGGYDLQAGVDARGLYGKRVGYAFGLGFHFGGIVPQGVDFSVDVLPVGLGLALPRLGFVALVGGVRPYFASFQPYALFSFPVELRAEIDLGRRVRVIAAAELDFSTVGQGHVPGTDGFSGILALRYGKADDDGQWGRGRYVGLGFWEFRGVPYLGFVLGTQASFAN